ncbi:MFS transporter [uncultured Algimonas sp.]|uniref:MFS transporter n=1 Tax=uncultured Algimonas sp. TaxID=1547920 RepID=UPI00263406EA|nr:MFS transporter [uncultured Algimonas sp.]
MSNRVSYGVGHAMISAKNMLFHFFFLFYFANVIGLPAWQVMAATVLAILIDAVSDPVMGQISDNTRSRRWGRRHGWIVASSLPTAAAMALLFSPPAGMSQTALFLWMAGFMIGTRVFITGYTVPYFALAADMSDQYDERTAIVGTRTIFENIFNLLVFILAFTVFLPDREGLEDGMLYEPGYAPLALTLGLIGVAGALFMVLGTWNRVDTTQPRNWAPGKPWYSAFANLREALRFTEFRTLTLGFSLLVMLYSTISQLSLFVGTYVWRFDQTEKLITSLVPFSVIIPAALAAGWWSRRADKREAALWLTWLFGLSFSLPFALYLVGFVPPIGSTELLVLVAVSSGFGYAGMVGALILSYSMMADVSDLMTLETGRKREGLLFAAFTFANKLAFAGGLIIATLGLTLIDLPDAALPSEVDDSTTRGLAIYSIIVNLALALTAWWAYHRYSLSRERHAVLQQQLREARPVEGRVPEL